MQARTAPALWVALLLVLGGCLVSGLTPSDTDRQAIVTIDDFADWLERLEVTLEATEQDFAKRRVVGSYELSYVYEGRGAAGDGGEVAVSLQSEVSVYANEVSARRAYRTYHTGLGFGLGSGGATMRALDAGFDWGPDVQLFAIVDGRGQQIGNGLVTRRGRAASYVLVTGLFWSDATQFEQALWRKLGTLEAYDPKRDPVDPTDPTDPTDDDLEDAAASAEASR